MPVSRSVKVMNVRNFETLDEMLQFLGARQVELDSARETHPIKVEHLRHGDYFASVRPDHGVIIYGEVIEDTGDDEDNEGIAESRTSGYVFGRHFSPMCPGGELGSTHVTNIHFKVPPHVFEKARAMGWGPPVT